MSSLEKQMAQRKEKIILMRERENSFKSINGGIAMQKNVPLTVKTEIDISHELIAGCLCSAIEQGSGYWARIVKETGASILFEHNHDYLPKYYFKYFHGGSTLYGTVEDCTQICVSCGLEYQYPYDECIDCGGALRFDGKGYVLDMDAIKRGIKVMAEKYSRHFGDFQSERGDAITADVFLQCCLFGEIVYA